MEVLVVVGIIAVVAALLYPVLASSRREALSTPDVSNMRQIYMALYMYGEDSGGSSPSDLSKLELYRRAPDVFASALDDKRVALPDGKWPATPLVPTNQLTADRKISYAYLRTIFGAEGAYENYRDRPNMGILASPWLGQPTRPVIEGDIPHSFPLKSVCGPPLDGPILRIVNDGSLFRLPRHKMPLSSVDSGDLFWNR